MVLVSWNVNSVRARLDHLLRYIEERRPDVFCLQEIKAPEEDFPRDQLAARGYHAVVVGQKNYNGVAVLARNSLANPVAGFPQLPIDHPLNSQSRLLAVTVGEVRVMSIYVPNGEVVGSEKFAYKLHFFGALREYLERERSSAPCLCVAGDFNVAPEARDVYDPEAWRDRVLCSTPEREAFEAVRALGFADCLRRHHPGEGVYSWWDYRGGAFWKGQGLRIDHVWATPDLAERCTACDVDLSPRKWKRPSDHAPVRAEFSV